MSDTPEPPAFMRRMDSAFDFISKICLGIAGVALVVMTVIFAWLVFGRYVLNNTPTWVEQISLLLLMVIAFLGSAVGVHQNTHLAVVLFRDAAPSRIRTFFVALSDVVLAVFGGYLFWYGVQLTQFKWKTLIPLIQISEGLRSLPLTICGALLFLFSTGHLIRLYLGVDKREDGLGQG